MAKKLRFAIAAIEILMGIALLILHRFAYFRAGMYHHAKFERMRFLRDYVQDFRWVFWAGLAVLCLWLTLRLKKPLWYVAVGMLLAAGLFVLLFLPVAKTLTIYYYLFLTNAALLVLHAIGAVITKTKGE